MLNIGVRELEKKIEEKKKAIASFKDKFTTQDELTELIRLQEQTNELLILTNRILFTQLKTQLGGETPILEGLGGLMGDNYRTRVFRVDNLKFSILNRSEKIFTLKGSGIISEIELVSSNLSVDNKAYSVRIVADDNIVYDNSWDVFETRNMHEADMTCFDDTNNEKYVLLFQGICYNDSCTLEIYDSSAEFDYINVKYHEKIGFM